MEKDSGIFQEGSQKIQAFETHAHLDLFEDPELLAKVKEDHKWHVEHQKEMPL